MQLSSREGFKYGFNLAQALPCEQIFVFTVLASGNRERFFFNIVLLLHFQTNQDFFSNLLSWNYWGF